MAELEVPTDHLHETLHEKAHEGGGGFNLRVALSSALIAVLAAVTALLGGNASDEAMMSRLKSSDTWGEYQADSVKAKLLATKVDLLRALGRRPAASDVAKIGAERAKQADLKLRAAGFDRDCELSEARGTVFSRGVTLFQIAIALGAIAVLTQRKPLWLASLLVSLGGVAFLVHGLMLPH